MSKKSAKVQATVESKLVREMTASEYRQCRRLGYKDGCIRDDLQRIYRDYYWSKSKVVLAKIGGRVRSWALIDRTKASEHPVVQLWTNTRWRRMGLGKKVIGRVKQILQGRSWDRYYTQAPEFFKSVGVHHGW